MNSMSVGARALCAVVAVLVPAGVVAGCGGKEKSSSTSQQSKPPAKLSITATGSEKDLKFQAPPKATAGATEITFTNNAEAETGAQLLQIQGKREDAEIVAQLESATEGKAVASWFGAAGGVGALKPGENGTVTQELKPGTYYVVPSDSPAKGPLASFTVAPGQGGAKPPATNAKITATDYAFSGQNVKVGQPVEFRNEGKEWHHFIGAPIRGNATLDDVKKAIQENQGGGGGPLDERNSIETTVMNGGVSQISSPELKPGRWVFMCFVSDRGGGPPHAQKGMVSEIEVLE